MTITKAIEWLGRMQQKHGGQVLVYFDCPKCGAAFTPTTLVTAAVHVGTEGKAK